MTRSLIDEALADAVEAFDRQERWEIAIVAAITTLFEFLAARSERATACLTDGAGALGRHEEVIERFADLLQPGFALAPSPPPTVVAEAIGGGIYEIVRGHALEGRLAELPAAAPDATIVALSPFVGPDSAGALASSTKVQGDR